MCRRICGQLRTWFAKTKVCRFWTNQRGKIELFWLVVGFVLLIFDMVTDIIVAIEYRRKGDVWWFALTLCFILVPLIPVSLMTVASVPDTPSKFYIQLNTCLMFVLSSIFSRYLQQFAQWRRTFWNFRPCGDDHRECGCSECTKYHEELAVYYELSYNLSGIRYVETILESAPQWCLQVYVMFRQWYFPWYTVLSTVFSLLSLAWGVTVRERAERFMERCESKLKPMVLFFAHQLLCLFSRLFSIVMFAYVFKSYVFLVLTIHLLIMNWFVVFLREKRYTCRTWCHREFMKEFSLFCLFSFPFLFHESKPLLNVFELYSPLLHYTIYMITSVENVILIITAVLISRPDGAHLNILGPIALSFVSVCLVLSVVLSVLCYYKHRRRTEEPTGQVECNENNVHEAECDDTQL